MDTHVANENKKDEAKKIIFLSLNLSQTVSLSL